MDTLNFYNENALEFVNKTKNVSMIEIQEKFMNLMKPGGYILDLGCGSGRDTKAFLEHGFIVDPVDGSKEICDIVSRNLGINVRCLLFSELNEIEKYDGVFACASLLHVPYEELSDILNKIKTSLKSDGLFYMSFKYGNEFFEENQKHYTNLTEESVKELLNNVKEFEIQEIWISGDNLPGRIQKWINVISKKR